MPGNRGVHKGSYGAASFAAVFERHLGAVFETAWRVVLDREVAAEVTRDTFADAWAERGSVPAEMLEVWLLDSAHDRAVDWLRVHNPHRLEAPPDDDYAMPDATWTGGMGPVLRARVVAALELQGVPTRLDPGAKPLKPPKQARSAASPAQVRLWLGAGAAALVVGLVVATVVLKDDPTSSFASPIDAARDTTTQPSPSTSALTATTSTTAATTTTTTEATSTTRGPTTTAAPVTVPPTAPPQTPPAPAPPTILVFWGAFIGGGQCSGGQEMLSMWWNTEGATSARVRPDGGGWASVEVPMGFHSACTAPGTRWHLEASNSGGTAADSFVAS